MFLHLTRGSDGCAKVSDCFSPLQPTDESEVTENGLVSQHAYTVTGAEQVRLAAGLSSLSWLLPVSCSTKQELEVHSSNKHKADTSDFHRHPTMASSKGRLSCFQKFLDALLARGPLSAFSCLEVIPGVSA